MKMRPKTDGDSERRSNVAILDTGIDASHPLIPGKIAIEDCWDFSTIPQASVMRLGVTHLLTEAAPRAKTFCAGAWKKRAEDEDTGTLINPKVPPKLIFEPLGLAIKGPLATVDSYISTN